MAPALPFIMMAGLGFSAASSIYSMVNAPAPPVAPKDTASRDKSALEAAYAQAQALRKRQGSSSTILTGPLGLSETPKTVQATLGS